jgi:ankyrin repeat protein
MVVYLMDNGADPRMKGVNNSTVLHIAAERNFVEIAKYILEFDNYRYKDLLFEVTDIDEEVEEGGFTCMHIACEWNSFDLIILFWELGGEKLVNIKDAEGVNAMDFAYQENQEDCYRYLAGKMGVSSYRSWILCSVF